MISWVTLTWAVAVAGQSTSDVTLMGWYIEPGTISTYLGILIP